MELPFIDPNVAYLLLVFGLLMGILALFSPGTGILEIGALFALVVAGIGIINADINLWALILLLIGVFPFILALRRRQHWAFLFLSVAALIVGSIFLFRGTDEVPGIHPLLATITSLVAVAILWIVSSKGLDAIALRPNMDLTTLIGRVGYAHTNIRQEGTVYVAGEEWSARSTQLIPLGSPVKVVGREGLVLLVEPEVTNQESTPA